MLIINADDYGKNSLCTDNILSCFAEGRITSASAMVFMADSERSADLALTRGLETGLHLNLSLQFSGGVESKWTKVRHDRLVSSFLKSKYAGYIYNPLIKKDLEYAFKSQYEEYVRLYKTTPSHIDGHRHLHLCANMMINPIIPEGTTIRKNFTFWKGEKSTFNRFCRRIGDGILRRRYESTDYFFDIVPISHKRVSRIISCAKSHAVELMVHPERPFEYSYLMGDEFQQVIGDVEKGGFLSFVGKSFKV